MKNNAKKSNRGLVILLVVLILALLGVVGYILLREYQYGVSDKYYDSLRKGWLMLKGAMQA